MSLFTIGCGQSQVGCESLGDLEFVCGPVNAEDLVLAPGTDWILSSGMSAGGGFYLIDSDSGDWETLEFASRQDSAAYPACPAAPSADDLETHGLNIRSVSEDLSMLYVVGHGGREAIEVFEVDTGSARPDLTWVGCVLMPDGLAANSVASFADGSLVATVLFMPGTTFADATAAAGN